MLDLGQWEKDYLAACEEGKSSVQVLVGSALDGLTSSLKDAFGFAERNIESLRCEISDLESLQYIDPGRLVSDRLGVAKVKLKDFTRYFVNMQALVEKYSLKKLVVS